MKSYDRVKEFINSPKGKRLLKFLMIGSITIDAILLLQPELLATRKAGSILATRLMKLLVRSMRVAGP